MDQIDAQHAKWLKLLSPELDRRQKLTNRLDRYHAGYPDTPEHVKEIKAETEYRVLLRQAVTNWPELIVDSAEERLEVVGFDFGPPENEEDHRNDEAWGIWRACEMEAAASELQESTLIDGRAFVIVWPGEEEGSVQIVTEHANTVIVAYDPQTGEPTVALRRWQDEDQWFANIYTSEALYKFETSGGSLSENTEWKKREVTGEAWPLKNPLRPLFPVVEFVVNPTLSGLASSPEPTGSPRKVSRIFGSAHGEFEREIPIIDRINTTVFAGLLGQAFASFPVRAMIGDPMNYKPVLDKDGNPKTDDQGNPLMEAVEPFKAAINRLVQIENPDGKLIQLPQSGLDHYIKFAESHIRHLAAVTKTPSYYLLGEMINVSADAIRAAEAGLISKVRKHQRPLGRSWARVMRLAMFAVKGQDVGACHTKWKNPESRSLAEAADAASKLTEILPWQALAEDILGATPEKISKWQAEKAVDALNALPLIESS